MFIKMDLRWRYNNVRIKEEDEWKIAFSISEVSSSQQTDLAFLYFIFHFYFHIVLFFYFSIFRTTRVKVDRSHCHISHNLMV